MPNNSFKSDESFLEKLAVGAAGVKATINRLRELGYQPIELERGSSGYKIWKKIKIKRVRVPDILCLRSGQRFESRGKTKLEISMSHSLKDPRRAWNAGMRTDDLASFVLFQKANDNSPVDWIIVSPIHFVRIGDMEEAFRCGNVQITKPKGVEEGSEIRVIWPCTTANKDATVTEITSKSMKLIYNDRSGEQTARLGRKNFSLSPQCQVGDGVRINQIIASAVPILFDPQCDKVVDENFFQDRLQSAALSERYAAAKALRFRGYTSSGEILRERMLDKVEDIYVQLEAAAALAAYENQEGWEFLRNSINSEFLQVQLETVIVLSEIQLPQSEELLINVLIDIERNSEIRAGAAWGLGEFLTQKSADALVDTFNLTNLEIKVEAARALLKIAPPHIEYLVRALSAASPDKRDGIAWTLARIGKFDIARLVSNKDDINLRQWASYIAGYGKNDFTEEQILELSKNDPEVFFAASVLWQILDSWVYNLGEF